MAGTGRDDISTYTLCLEKQCDPPLSALSAFSVLCFVRLSGCVVRVFGVMYAPVSVPPNVALEAVQPVIRVFPLYCVSHHCYQHHFSAL